MIFVKLNESKFKEILIIFSSIFFLKFQGIEGISYIFIPEKNLAKFIIDYLDENA